MMRTRSIGVLFVAALVGCAGSLPTATTIITKAPAMVLHSDQGAEVRLVWRNPDLHPVQPPVAIGNVAVTIVLDRDELFLVGVEPIVGAKLWQQPITGSATSAFTPVTFTKVGDDKVAYLRPSGGEGLYPYAELVVADARTGADLTKSPSALFASAVMVCARGAAVCAVTQHWNADRGELVRLEIATGAYVTENRNIPLRAAMLSNDGLFDLGDGPKNTLGLFDGGRLRWVMPLHRAFPSELHALRGRWRRFADQGVVVGSAANWWVRDGATLGQDLSSLATAGLSEATGEVLWRAPGSLFPCPQADFEAPVRCRARGTVRWRKDQGYTFRDLDVIVEGFNPATGAATWSLAMGAAERLAYGEQPPIAGPHHVAVDRPSGVVVLDYLTGHLTWASSAASYWCVTEVEYTLASAWERRRPRPRPGGLLTYLCDARGKPAHVLPSAAATFAAGAHIDRHAVIATREGLLGFEAR